MPSLQRLTLQEISSRFTLSDEFYFDAYKDGMFTYMTVKEFAYLIIFFPSPFAHLQNPCTIDDLIAAIDESRHFELQLTL